MNARHPLPLGALLGPGEPELTCEECFRQLDRYVELGAGGDAAIPGMRPHLRGCPACHEDHEDLVAYLRTEDA